MAEKRPQSRYISWEDVERLTGEMLPECLRDGLWTVTVTNTEIVIYRCA